MQTSTQSASNPPRIVLPADDARALARATAIDAPVRLGVLVNPNARRGDLGRRRTRAWLERTLGRSRIVHTPQPGYVMPALRALLAGEGVNVLAVSGGDGTLHSALGALWSLLDAAEAAVGHPVAPPRLLLLNGGTMNMVARAMGTPGAARHTLRWFLGRWGHAPLGAVRVRRVGVLRVCEASATRLGFIFGSEVVYNALWLYTQFGEGYAGLARLLAKAGVAYRFRTPLWEQYGRLLEPPKTPALLDGVAHAPYEAAVASTVGLTLARGWIRALDVPEGAEGFHVRLVLETHPGRLLAMIPLLMRQGRHPRVLDRCDARKLVVWGRYTLDGELYDPPQEDTRVEVTRSERAMLAVLNEEMLHPRPAAPPPPPSPS